ncbi:Argonaute-3 [Ephemera danica]|nr:Argonaute-3 [Ephemera danica]
MNLPYTAIMSEQSGRNLGRSRGRTSRPPQESVPVHQQRPGGPPMQAPHPMEVCTGPSGDRSEPMEVGRAGGSMGRRGSGAPRPGGGRGGPRGGPVVPQVRTRPETLTSKQGKSGTQIALKANYFNLASVTDWVLYQYHVDFAPEEDRSFMRRRLLNDHKEILGGFIFDGMILYSNNRHPNPTIFHSQREGDDAKIQITLTFTRQVNQGDHEYLQFFNILMRKCLAALKLQLVGRNFFDPQAKVDIAQYHLELWPGYVTSIRQHEQQILMCTEIAHKVMRTDTVLSLLYKLQQNNDPDIKHSFQNAVLGLVVLTDYNNRTYRVDDVDFRVSPNSTFKMKDQEITYAAYYNQRYNLKIKDMNQPLLLSKSKAKDLRAGVPETVFLVPELCRMTGLTDDMRSNYRLMSALAEHTRVGPSKRVEKLQAFSRRLRSEKAIVEDLQEWNMAVDSDLVKFNGRILPSEKIYQGSERQTISYDSGPLVDWTHKLKNTPMLTTSNVDNWFVLVPRDLDRISQTFIPMVMECAQKMGMEMKEPGVQRMADDRQSTYVNALDALLSKEQPQLVVCLVSNNRSDRYGAIKKKCCVERAVPTQVITNKAMTNRGAVSVATKIAIQINCKLGGAPWAIEMPMKGTMVVGMDASHDTMNKGMSYGALVASLNNNFSRYYSAVTAHNSGEELSNDVSLNLVKAIQKFRLHNDGALPSRIFMYRDGVGDGQIPYVYQHEIAMLKSKLTELYGGETWKFTFIVVSKRINTRIFTANNHGNAPPGTVVDDCITLPERYDFFVVSQSVRQGTVSPTSYNVLTDNSNLDPDKIQRFTYKMTHLYYNWSGTVRVPAPVQYAHKLAQLVGQNIHRVPHNELDDLLYFL